MRVWQQKVMSIAFHRTAKNSAGITFQVGIFIRLSALNTLVTCRPSSGQGSKAEVAAGRATSRTLKADTGLGARHVR